MYDFREEANIFPMMQGEAFDALKNDIKENGLKEPIVLLHGKVLDGRNRYKACEELGVQPRFVDTFTETPLEDVLSLNLHRRHLNTSQRAVVAAKLANITVHDFKGNQYEDSRKSDYPKTSAKEAANNLNVDRSTVFEAKEIMEKAPERIAEIESGQKTINEVRREIRKKETITKLESIEEQEVKAVEGVYDVIVIDPPWPMQKIARDVRPNQVEFDYPTMSEEVLEDLEIPCADDCHVWVWTTHKFLPMALRLLDEWGLKYVCTFTWHKPGGFQPIGLPQYNCEFALYARNGTPAFIDTKAFPVCFNAPRGKHSEKPEEFYDVVRRVTAGRRLDMFNRRSIDGFDVWGNES